MGYWTLLNPRRPFMRGHLLYAGKRGELALADWSIRNMLDPSSTDDGLLLFDGSRPVRIKGDRVSIPLRTVDGSESWTGETLHEMLEIAEHLKRYGARFEVAPETLLAAHGLLSLVQPDGEPVSP